MSIPEENAYLERIRQQHENIIVGEHRQVIHEEPAVQPLTQQQAQEQAKLEKMADNLAYEDFFQSISALPQQAEAAAGGAFRESKEEKCRLFNPSGQRGMNCAVGGLGNAGVGGKMLKNDGSCGHFYSMYKEGDSENYSAMLMGMESDAYRIKNQLGHTHDLLATGEKASSFGAQRFDEIGDKYGGRQCDLTGWTAEEISGYMEALEKAMQGWQATKEGMQHPDAVDTMRRLAGKSMTLPELAALRWVLEGRAVEINP